MKLNWNFLCGGGAKQKPFMRGAQLCDHCMLKQKAFYTRSQIFSDVNMVIISET